MRLACCHGTDELGCGRGRQSFDARCELLVCSACCRNVCESCTRANFRSAPRVRTASQRITLGRAFDCLILEGSGGAMAPACGAILADHEHVCVILACRAAWTGCREAHVQSFGAWARRRFLAEAMEISFISFSDISLGRAGYFSTFLSTFIFFNISSPQVMAYRFQNFQWFCPLPLCCVRHNRWKRWQTSSKLR